MSPRFLRKIYMGVLIVIFGGIVLHAPFSVVTSVLFPQFELLFKSWKEILLIVASILIVIAVWREKKWQYIYKDRILQAIGIYIALHLLLLVPFWQGLAASAAGLMIDLRYVIFFALVYIGLRLYPEYRSLFVKVGIIGAGVILIFALLQVFVLPPDILKYIGYSRDTIVPYLTVDQNPDYVRINSTLRGPNPVGAYAVIALACVAAAFVKRKIPKDRRLIVLAGVLGAGGVVALWASYSRSALVAGVMAVGLVILLTIGRRLSRRAWIISFIILGGLLGGFLAVRETSFVSHVLLHENPHGGSVVSSNDGHVESLEFGTSRLLAQPLGAGVGSTGSASLYGDSPLIIENQYLFIAHETGWVGLIVFMAISMLVLARLWRLRSDWLALGVFASGIGLLAIGLLLPVWADDTVSIVWWGLAAVAIASKERYVRSTTK